MKRKISVFLLVIIIVSATGCTWLFKQKKNNDTPNLDKIESFEKWQNERAVKKEESQFSKLKVKGNINLLRENGKPVKMQFGLLLNENGDEALAVYKGMNLLLKYQVENQVSTIEPEDNEVLPETKTLLPLIINQIREVFLPETGGLKKIQNELRQDNSYRVTFEAEKIFLNEKELIFSKYMIFYYGELKEVGFFNETNASKEIQMQFRQYQGSQLFEYPSEIRVLYIPESLEILFLIDEFTYQKSEE
ncbi:MAG: hypothetical protein PHV06_01910 [bacterium]|nr:hypothetical protein [bacterium]